LPKNKCHRAEVQSINAISFGVWQLCIKFMANFLPANAQRISWGSIKVADTYTNPRQFVTFVVCSCGCRCFWPGRLLFLFEKFIHFVLFLWPNEKFQLVT